MPQVAVSDLVLHCLPISHLPEPRHKRVKYHFLFKNGVNVFALRKRKNSNLCRFLMIGSMVINGISMRQQRTKDVILTWFLTSTSASEVFRRKSTYCSFPASYISQNENIFKL